MTDNGPTKQEKRTIAPGGPAAGEHRFFPLFDPGEFAKLGNRNLEVMTRAARAYFDGATEMNKELAEFMNQRMRKDFETARAIMGSKNSEDAFSAQAEFVENTIRDYAEETSRVFNLAADIARHALKPPAQ